MIPLKQRAVDLVLAAQILFLMTIGFFVGQGTLPRFALYPSLLPSLVLASFVAVFFSFRTMTRCLWIILSPLSIWFAMLFGLILHERLYIAPGFQNYEAWIYVRSTVPCSVFVYLFPLPIWTIIYLFGWRLVQDDAPIQRRTVQLKELLALTGVFGAVTMLAQHSAPADQFLIGKDFLIQHYHALIVCAAIECTVLIPILLAAFSRSWILAFLACLVYIFICFAVDTYHARPGQFANYRNLASQWPVLYNLMPYRGYRFLGGIELPFLMILCRGSGIRMVRSRTGLINRSQQDTVLPSN